MNQTIWAYFLDMMLEYLTEELDVLRKAGSDDILKTTYGVERIKDYILLEEMRLYHDKLNVDRLVSFGACLALMKTYAKYNIGAIKIDNTNQSDKPKNEPKLEMARSFFKNMGSYPMEAKSSTKRSFFKNYN
jgi:hypothetical protein